MTDHLPEPSRGNGVNDPDIERIAALGEPIRRALYAYVARQDHAVDRDEAAAAAGIARHVAKFHLDRLEEDGLLVAEFRRPPGRSGPGAGRPSKRYRRAPGELSVHLPARQYDLAGRVMARAITEAAATGKALPEALREAAREVGRNARRSRTAKPDGAAQPRSVLERACEVLEEQGYEPRTEGRRVVMANCPFHSLAQEYTDLVCGMNVDLVEGLLDGLNSEIDVRLEPEPERCCVTLYERSAADPGGRG